MTITVHYWYDSIMTHPCWASTEKDGKVFYGCGYTWEEAKKEVLERVTAYVYKQTPPPPDEEVTLHGVS